MLLETIDQLNLSKNLRILGLDVGEKTIGLALSDIGRQIATPMETIRRSKFSKDVVTLLDIIRQQEVGGLIVGWPVNMDGTAGARAQSTRQFALNISKHTDIPIAFWDERMSTMAVNRMMIDEMDINRKRRSELVDKLAASYMLQGALDYLNRK